MRTSRALSTFPSAAGSSHQEVSQMVCDVKFTSLTYKEIVDLADKNNIQMTDAEKSQLSEFIRKNTGCQEFGSIIEKLKSLEASKMTGVGLTAREKTHYNQLNDLLAESKANPTDTLSVIKSKLSCMREMTPEITQYRNIMVLYETYIKILNNPLTWRAENLLEISRDWDLQKYFACISSVELLRFYEIYEKIALTLVKFSDMVKSDGSKLPVAVRHAMQLYCIQTAQQIKTSKMYAIASMLARLRSADERHDIHYDDIIFDTIARIEITNGRRVIKEDGKERAFTFLNQRRRQGLSYDCYRRFVQIIKAYFHEINANDAEQENFKAYMLNVMPLLSSFSPNFSAEAQGDYVASFLLNQFQDIKNIILRKRLHEPSVAITNLIELENHIQAIRQYHLAQVKENPKLKNPYLERHLCALQVEIDVMVWELSSMLFGRHQVEMRETIQEGLIRGDDKKIAALVQARQSIGDFCKQFRDKIDANAILLLCDFSYSMIQFMVEQPAVLSDAERRTRISVMLAKYYFFPVTDNNRAAYEAAILQLTLRLECFYHVYPSTSGQARYVHFSWIIFFLEEVLNPSLLLPNRYSELARTYQFTWVNYIPGQTIILQDNREVFLPECMASTVDAAVLNNRKSTRRLFLLENKELIQKVNEMGTHVINVIIPYVTYSPFVSLFDPWNNARYIKAIDDLRILTNELNEKIEAALRMPGISKDTIKMLDNFKLEIARKYSEVHDLWQLKWYENIMSQLKPAQLSQYLRHSHDIVDLKKLHYLITKIESAFAGLVYCSMLMDAIVSACVQRLIDTGIEALKESVLSQRFQSYLFMIEQIADMQVIGPRVIRQVTDSVEITQLLHGHIERSDGSQPAIGTLVTTLYPTDNATESVVASYIKPYACKRLQYISATCGAAIQYRDISFFNAVRSIPACASIFQQEQEHCQQTFILPVIAKHAAWTVNVAKVIELFGSREHVSIYRARGMMELLKKETVTHEECERLQELMAVCYRLDVPEIDPDLILPDGEGTLGEYLEHCINNCVWTPVREEIISLYSERAAQRYHTRCIYQLLNNKAPQFGIWLQAKLNESHPNEIFGEQDVDSIYGYIQSLIRHAEQSCHDFNVDEKECEAMLDLVANLKLLKLLFEKLDHAVGKLFITHIGDVEKGIKLARLAKKLLEFYAASNSDIIYAEPSMKKLLSQVIFVQQEIERNKMISFANINAYIDFLATALLYIPVDSLKNFSDVYIDYLFNFFLTLSEHVKKIIMILTNSEAVSSTSPDLFLAMVNCIGSNQKIDDNQSEILTRLSVFPDLHMRASKIFSLAYLVNTYREHVYQAFRQPLLRTAGIKEINENPAKYALACAKKIVSISDNVAMTNAYVDNLAKVIGKIIPTIPMRAFEPFAKSFLLLHDALSTIANKLVAQDVTPLRSFSLLPIARTDNASPLLLVLKKFHTQYSACLITAAIEKYMGARSIPELIHLKTQVAGVYQGEITMQSIVEMMTSIPQSSSGIKKLLTEVLRIAQSATIQEMLKPPVKQSGLMSILR